MDYLERPTRNLFFTGKGGVGKTTLACATAIALADRGARVLLVSTDPASNLDEVLGVSLSNSPTPLPTVAALFALNVDPEEAAREYRERVIGPYRGVLPAVQGEGRSVHAVGEPAAADAADPEPVGRHPSPARAPRLRSPAPACHASERSR